MFFSLPSWAVALLLVALLGAATVGGYTTGRYLREHEAKVREPFGVLQGAILGVVGLILAFGLTLAVGRYQDRRAATVAEANAIGTAYLRAQLVAEPGRSASLVLLRRYTDLALQISREVPGSSGMLRTTASEGLVQRRLWRLAGRSIASAPLASADRLYVDSLNAAFDAQAARLSSLTNRVPAAVLVLEVFGGSRGRRPAGTPHLRPRAGARANARRRGARDAPAARDVRPRPPHPRAHHRTFDTAHGGACVDGAASGGCAVT